MGHAWLLRLFVPQRASSRIVVAVITLWIAWFCVQTYTVGKAASDEVVARFVEVSFNAQVFAVKQLEALQMLCATLECFGRLVAPFVVDVWILTCDLYFALPLEAQFGLVGAGVTTYAIIYSRMVRHMLFIPVSIGMWYLLPRLPQSFAHLFIPVIGLGIPVGGSLVAFNRRQRKECGFWISYWFLFPIMKIVLLSFKKYVPQSTSSSGFYWRVQCIWCAWLVLWGGSDLAFGVLIKLVVAIWTWVSHRGIVSLIITLLFSWKTKAQNLAGNNVANRWMWTQKLGKIASMGMNTLVLAGLVGILVVLMMYRLLSFVSSAIVWPWFLYELGGVVHRQTSALYRGKIALALLFLLMDWVFTQRWFIVPSFILDFIRIPLILLLNMFGEVILDTLLVWVPASTVAIRESIGRSTQELGAYLEAPTAGPDESGPDSPGTGRTSDGDAFAGDSFAGDAFAGDALAETIPADVVPVVPLLDLGGLETMADGGIVEVGADEAGQVTPPNKENDE